MIDINKHPIWQGNKLWGGINLLKKRGHLVRFFLARQYAKLFPRTLFVGITGSVGKTTTTLACQSVLSEKFKTISTKIDLDPILNILITILNIRPKTQKVLLEMGVEYPGEMEYYLNMVKPYIGVVTRVSFAHSEFLGSDQEILSEKGKLIEQLPENGYAILNWDDPLVRKLADKTAAQVIFFGTDSINSHVWAGNIKIKDYQTVFELNQGVERVEVRTNLLGRHMVTSLLAAAALGACLGMPLTTIKKGLEKVKSAPHRFDLIEGKNDSFIIDDTHNSSPAAAAEALETLNLLTARRRIVVLGEMKELGVYSEKLHREMAHIIYRNKVDLVFLGTGDANYIADELIKLGFLEDRLFANLQNPQIVSKLIKVLSKGDVVLIKGSRTLRLDEVVKKLSKK